ncbi:uncharacterized protein LOC100905073 [Galendromus occidentalis]|uniref:Uncharacterized protein LOC100905073 n=1 Tax=Galendromus occidentalis TaxID=34638 RepID=A0AAJ6QMZ8_9ACAR|nr:uncharacterized protein LOC100905073 [Galendromus occidentalis]
MVVQKDTITVTGLKPLYSEWSTIKPYLPPMPPEDITFDMPFVRVRSKPAFEGEKCLRVVAFHGMPGNGEHFQALGEALAETCNVDFIAPTFPDLKFTLEKRAFWQSTEERLALLEVFLKAIDVRDVDISIGHSTGGWAAVNMSLGVGNLKSRSFCLVCTNIPRFIRYIGPKWFQGNLCRALHYKFMEPLVVLAYELIISTFRLRRKMTAFDAMSSAFPQYAMRYWEEQNAPRSIREAVEKGVPRMMVYGGRDYLLKLEFSHLLASDLGNPDPKNHYTYEGKEDKQLKLIQQPQDDSDLPITVHFTQGGHHCYQQYPETMAKHLLQLANRADLFHQE